MKVRGQPIRVQVQEGQPVRFYRSGMIYDVKGILDVWRLTGRWWGREEARNYYRVQTSRGVYDIYRSSGKWLLERSVD